MTTFALPRTLGIVGKYRLDWIFVKAYLKDDPTSADSYRFAPHFARTMNEANEVIRRLFVRPCCHQRRSADRPSGCAELDEVEFPGPASTRTFPVDRVYIERV